MIEILALDVATKTGWRNSLSGGTWDFSTRRDESGGMRLLRFKAKIQEIIKLQRPDLVVFERTAGFHKSALIVQAELHGVLKLILDEENIKYEAYSATEIKKIATGKGNCGKPEMIKACKEKLGIDPVDDNHADACWIYERAKELYC